MRHPFGLEISDLETVKSNFEEESANEEAAKVVGGIAIGGRIPPYPKPPIYTTLAIGEEGGDVTTLALGEEGGDLY